MTETRTSDEVDGRLRLLVGLVGMSALLSLIFWVIRGAAGRTYVDWTVVAVAVAVAMAGARVRVRIRSVMTAFSSTSLAVLIALAVLPPEPVVIGTALGGLASYVYHRLAPIKLVFNTAKDVLSASGAAAITLLIPGMDPHAGTLTTIGTVAVCAATFFAIDELLIAPVLALVTRTRIRQHLLLNWDIRLGTILARMILAIGGILMYRVDPWMLLFIPVLGVGLHVANSSWLRARAEREAWQKLAQSTDEFNSVDLNGVLHTAITRGTELFSVDEVEVLVQFGNVPPRLVRGSTDGITYDGDPSAAPVRGGNAIPTTLDGYDGGPAIGQLVLRFHGPVKLSEREEYALHSFASALCTAIRNALAYAELARLAEQHAHNAAHDPLTGLANRRRLQDEATIALEQRPVRGITALLLIDLDHFKEVNDTLGHAAGDRVLQEIARRLVAAAPEEALVARLGGDEFAVLLYALAAPAIAAHRAQAILTELIQPMDLDGMRISVEASIGIATAPSHGGITELLRRADIAMYQAKRSGNRICVYARARDTANVGRLTLGGDLPRAIAEQEITVRFQPIVDLASGEVIAAEALARWEHPDKGDLNPREFLETVERSGILPAFADAVLDQALLAASGWRDAGFDLPVAVNVSPRSLLDRRFPGSVAAYLDVHGTPADRLILELTETLMLSQLEVVDQVLGALRDQGIRLALDDFGTGFSSLAMLSRVPVHELKIDREFVQQMEASAEAAAVVRSTVDLGRSLNLSVVAEGVESEPQRRTLWELGCVAGQGHLFARPMPAASLLAALRRGCAGRPGTLAQPLHEAGTVIRIPTQRRGNGEGHAAGGQAAGGQAGGDVQGLGGSERLPNWPA